MLALVKSRPTTASVAVGLISPDAALAEKLRAAMQPAQRFAVEIVASPLPVGLADIATRGAKSLLVCDVREDQSEDWLALERFIAQSPQRPPIIVLSSSVSDAAARRLLRLQIADWLPRDCSVAELRAGCEQALTPRAPASTHHANCLAFISAIGGAGSTTISLAAASALAGKGADGLQSVCAIDLDFQFGAMADHLDLKPNLQLAEVAGAPERLDSHLLEIMLSRHASGLTLLASPTTTELQPTTAPAVVERLLDLAATRFKHLVIDVPRGVRPCTESVLRGADRTFIVTDLSVIGLRHARRLADLLGETLGIETSKSVIVNKFKRFDFRGLRRKHAADILGDRLAGFVSDTGSLAREAQDRGVLLSELKRSNAVVRDLRAIVTTSAKGA